MLNRKYFEKRLFYYEKFSDSDYCSNECEDLDLDCNIGLPMLCDIYREAKRKHSVRIRHVEFYHDKMNIWRGLIDEYRTIFILMNKDDISKISERLKDILL